MIKTNERVKIEHKTVFFPRVKFTFDELLPLYLYGGVASSWFKTVLINYDLYEQVAQEYQKLKKSKRDGFKHIVDLNKDNINVLMGDLVLFSDGELDTIDLVVKYSLSYDQLRSLFKEILTDVDVDMYWKKHKKHAQKATTQVLYGVSHSSLDPTVKKKRINTLMEHYGCENPMHNDGIKEKLKRTMKEKYGVENNLYLREGNDTWRNRLFDTLKTDELWLKTLEYYCSQNGVKLTADLFLYELPLFARDFKLSVQVNNSLDILFDLYFKVNGCKVLFPNDVIFNTPLFDIDKVWALSYNERGLIEIDNVVEFKSISKYEKVLKLFLDKLNIKYIRNKKTILSKKEIDFYFPDLNIGIEINPNPTHNSNSYAINRCFKNSTKKNSYHYEKYKLAKNKGVKLIQLYSWDFHEDRFDTLTCPRLEQLLIGYKTKIYAKNVQIVKSQDVKSCRSFLDQYHTQGANRAHIYYEILYKGETLGIASFVLNNDCNAELKRLCYKTGVNIVGGTSKVIRQFFRDHKDVVELYSYSDNDIGDGSSYEKAGGEFVKETGPSLKLVSPTNALDRYSWSVLSKWGAKGGVIYKDALQKGIEPPTTMADIEKYVELELSHRLDDKKGYDKIYTSGSKLWKFKR